MRHSCLLTVILIIHACTGCGSADTAAERDGLMVFVDTATSTPIVTPVPDSVPSLNPATGKRTLMPGLYCPVCEQWYPVPAPEQINRQPGAALCPITKTPLMAAGPWPEESGASGGSR
ncbi:MAG: hypothetical protein GY758_34290 [Fuerstiella sp.]|nr:hypothetical protein [Fuerstiella sp.]MCP4511474.1 hypothetical protein [Fuerstiella sp.]